MPDQIVPESRIFRIGRECYIIYLGKELDDIRPFLRIGNSRDIPDEVLNVVSTTVISDDHVGNPLLEVLFVPRVKGRYLGDTQVVGTIRRFFKSFDLPTDEVTDYRKVKDGERRHMVWFYSSGNIHLRYDDQVIFDLDKREREDRHFVRLYEEAKGEFLRNPLRYIRQDFTSPGLILSNGNAYWFDGGELLSFRSNPGFVADLMSEGVDPDFISSMAYNLTRDEMDSHDAAVFVGFVKRTRQRRKQLKVITSEVELHRNLRLLFPERGNLPAAIEVADVSGKRKATFHDAIVSRRDNQWFVNRSGLPEIGFSADGDAPVQVNPEAGSIKVRSGESVFTFQPPRGFPVNLIGHGPAISASLDKYLGYTFSYIKDHLSEGEEGVVNLVDRYLRLLFDDISSEKASVSPLHKQTASNLRDSLKRFTPKTGGPSWFFYANALTLCELAIANLGDNHPMAKTADQVSRSLRVHLENSPSPEYILPFWGDLFIGTTPCLLWRATKRGFVAADLATTRDVNKKNQEITSLNEVPWHEERERLLALIRSLEAGGQGPLTEEQLALLAVADKKNESRSEESRKTEEKASEHRDSDDGHGFAGGRKTTDVKSDAKTEKSGQQKKKGGKKIWAWLILLLLLLVLLAGGVWLWDRSGKAPWRNPGDSAALTGGDSVSESSDSGVFPDEPDQSGGTTTGIEPDSETGGDGESGSTVGPTSDVADTGTSVDVESNQNVSDNGVTEDSDAAGGAEVNGSDTPTVDRNIAPRTSAEVDAYLDVEGRVNISEIDIHLASNEIAVMNGFKDLDYRVFTGNDPDWIYPGNSLNLPNREPYIVRSGDTIWFIAAREVRIDVEGNLQRYDEALKTLDDSNASDTDRSAAVQILKSIAGSSKAAAMRRMASDALTTRGL